MTAEQIVRALAALKPSYVSGGWFYCGVCRARDLAWKNAERRGIEQRKVVHAPDCLWLAARAYLDEPLVHPDCGPDCPLCRPF